MAVGRWYTGRKIRQIWMCVNCYLQNGFMNVLAFCKFESRWHSYNKFSSQNWLDLFVLWATLANLGEVQYFASRPTSISQKEIFVLKSAFPRLPSTLLSNWCASCDPFDFENQICFLVPPASCGWVRRHITFWLLLWRPKVDKVWKEENPDSGKM